MGDEVEIHVRMLSGDILTTLTSVNYSLKQFPMEFAEKHGYNPTQLYRFEFLIQREEEDEDEKETGEKLIRNGQETWGQRFPTGVYPMIHLLIQPPGADMEKEEKMELLRNVLDREKRMTTRSNDELYELFCEWNLTYTPPKMTNRFKNLQNFVRQSPEHFPEMTEENMEKAKREKEDVTAENQRLWKEVAILENLFGFHDTLVALRREMIGKEQQSQSFARTRAERMIEYRALADVDPTGSSIQERCLQENDSYFTQYLTMEEMYRPGPDGCINCQDPTNTCSCPMRLFGQYYSRICELREQHGENIRPIIGRMIRVAWDTANEYRTQHISKLRRKL